MAITISLLTNDTDTVDRTTYTTASISPAGEKLLLLFIYAFENDAAVASINSISGLSLTWEHVVTNSFTTANPFAVRTSVYRAVTGASPGSGAVSVEFNDTMAYCAWAIVEVSGADTGNNGADAIRGTGENEGATNETLATVVLSATPNGAGATIMAVQTFETTTAHTFTTLDGIDVELVDAAFGSNQSRYGLHYGIGDTDQTPRVDFSSNNVDLWSAVAVELAPEPAFTQITLQANQPASTGSISAAMAGAATLEANQPASTGELALISSFTRLQANQPATVAELADIQSFIRLSANQPSATSDLRFKLFVDLSAEQPASTGEISSVAQLLKTLEANQPAASTTLRLVADIVLSANQPASTSELTAAFFYSVLLEANQPASSGELSLITSNIVLRANQPAATTTLALSTGKLLEANQPASTGELVSLIIEFLTLLAEYDPVIVNSSTYSSMVTRLVEYLSQIVKSGDYNPSEVSEAEF